MTNTVSYPRIFCLILAPSQNMFDISQKMTHATKFFCNAKIASVQALQNFKTLLMEVKNSWYQNYSFMVLPGKALRSIIRHFCMYQNISFLALENLKKPLQIGQFSINSLMWRFFFSYFQGQERDIVKRTKFPDYTPQGLSWEHQEAIVLMQ